LHSEQRFLTAGVIGSNLGYISGNED
jgi:hypothetical protein